MWAMVTQELRAQREEHSLRSWHVVTPCPLTIQGMITLILATDMARHAEIMDSFKEKMENFDYSNEEHLTLVGCVSCVFGKLSHSSVGKTRNLGVSPGHGVLE